MEVTDIVLEILKEITEREDIGAETELMDSGYLDSLTLVVLMDALEQRFEVSLFEKEIPPHIFSTVQNLTEYLEREMEMNK